MTEVVLIIETAKYLVVLWKLFSLLLDNLK